MREQWLDIEEFPIYAVSTFGNIVNLKTDMMRSSSMTAQGLAKMTLVRDGRYYTRSVAVLVANAFLPRDELYLRNEAIFDTPINLDGDRMNCRVDNLMWRPRWFAIRYHQQFFDTEFRHANPTLELIDTGEVFDNLMDPCMKYGLLYRDVITSFMNHTHVLPTGQKFNLI